MDKELGLTAKELEQIVDVFKEIPEIESVVIYGSRALGTFSRGSDIDLALKGKINLDIIAKVKRILDEELPVPYFFDITNYQSITNQELKSHIDNCGKIIYSKNYN